MRASSFLAFTAVSAAWLACSSITGEETGTSSENLTDRELAQSALGILGAPTVTPPAGEQKSCGFTGCHSINTVTLRHWNDTYRTAKDVLESSRSPEEKINFFRADHRDPASPFTPERLGFMAAGAHLVAGKGLSETDFPSTFKQAALFAQLFEGRPELYEEFREAVKMPVLDDFPKLTPSKYETVLNWFERGMPLMHELIPEQRPTRCTDDFAALRTRTIQAKNKTWAAINRTQHMPMLGCPDTDGSPTGCFTQVRDGKEVFPSAANVDFARTWPLGGSTVRVLRQLTARNSYWLRTSADGRFTMTGGGSNGGAQAIDLRATLEGGRRDIGLRASYDPDFWPDNKAFMFQGGTKFCSQSLLEKPSTTLITFEEPECTRLSAASGLYQTVGQSVDDNSMSDRFILYSDWVGDSGSYSASAKDTVPRGGSNSSVSVYTAVATGTDTDAGYQVTGPGFKVMTPYRGDTMMARSGRLLGNRWAYGPGSDGVTPWGYAIEKLDYRLEGGRYQFTLSPLGNVCLKGNKANFSFDERFLTTHHYNEPGEFTANDDPAYRQKGSADIWVVDFITGQKVKVTKMGPGQFAIFPHFRSDGWLYFLAVEYNTGKYYVAASDWAIRRVESIPTP
jgi:hypothetical protein